FFVYSCDHPYLHSFPTRRSSDLLLCYLCVTLAFYTSSCRNRALLWRSMQRESIRKEAVRFQVNKAHIGVRSDPAQASLGERATRSEEHTSELQSQSNLVCRLLLE